MGISVHAGDTMTITCNYRNESTTPVVGATAAECAMPGASCSPNLIEPSVMTCGD
jgi:hypothetical protein